MKFSHRMYQSLSGRMVLAFLAILFVLPVGRANAASEPGTVTIVLEADPRSLDSGEATRSVEGQVLSKNIFESLTVISSADSSISPGLAQSWKQIDPHTWQFFLRKGVKFHDGEDFNAQAVVFSFKRLYEKKIFSQTRNKFFGHVSMEAKALDSHTVEVKTSKPEPLMLTLMGLMAICSPNTPMDKWSNHPVGTGPYKFIRWDAGSQIVLERFDGYWGKQPQVKKAIYMSRSESSVRAAMVLIGEADLTPNIAKQDANRPDMDVSYLNSETTFLRIGGEWEPPLNDRRVRMAMNYAVDRNALRGTIFSKDVIPATQVIVPSIFGYNPDLKVWPYDPKKAKQLLDEARKDGVPVDKEILLAGRIGIYPGYAELIEIMLTMYKAVGLNVKLKMFEQAVYKPYDNKPYTTASGPYIAQRQHNNSYGDAGFSVFYNYHSKGGNSVGSDKILDDLIDKAQVATGEERRKLWQAAFKRAHEEVIPMVPLFHMVAYARIGKRINFKPSLATNGEISLAQITFK